MGGLRGCWGWMSGRQMSENSKRALNVRATNVWKFKMGVKCPGDKCLKIQTGVKCIAMEIQNKNGPKNSKRALNVRPQMSENSMGVKCLALNVRATNVWKSKRALNVRRQMSENSHWRQMSLGIKCHMPISRQMSLASIVTTSNRHQRSGLKSLGDKRPRRQTAWIRFIWLQRENAQTKLIQTLLTSEIAR